MDSKTFFENFETIANAPGGIARLRELILDLAVRGSLVQKSNEDVWGEEIRLRNVGKMIRGVTYAKAESSKSEGSGLVPLLGAANIQREINYDGLTYVPERLIKSDQIVCDGDVLICMSSGSKHLVGKTGSISLPPRASFGAFCAVFRISDSANHEYIAMFFKSPVYRNAISSVSRGIGINNLRIGDVESIAFVLPPIEEQKRIVAKVDELMALCDELEIAQNQRNSIRTSARKSAIDAISTATTPDELNTAWKRISDNWLTIADTPESISSLRSLILDLAGRGSLDSSEADADGVPINVELEKLKLNEDKLWKLSTALPEPAQGWNRVPMARLGQWGSGGTPTASRKEYYLNGTIPWAVIGDLNNAVMLTTESLITKKALESSSTKMIPIGAVLVAMYGASIGKSAISGIECCTNQAIAHCVVDEDVITSEYMFLVVKSLKDHLIEMGKGAAQPNISQSVLKHLVIDIPPLSVQKRVIERTDELLDLCNQLELSLIARNELARKISGAMAAEVAA